MFKIQMKFQKILPIIVLFFGALFFIYSIGLMTDLYPLVLAKVYGGVTGVEFFDEVQPYNKELVKYSIITLVAMLIPFVFATNTRRKYYIDNYISSAIEVGVLIFSSIFLINKTHYYRTRFITVVDIEAYIAKCEKKGWRFSGTTIWFDLGYLIATLLLLAVVLIILNYVWKAILVSKENKMLKGKE